jgi:hypothetical protein
MHMKRLSIAFVLATMVSAAGVATSGAQNQGQGNQGQGGPPPVAEPPMSGIQWARGEAPPNGGAATSPNLNYNGGPIMAAGAAVEPIFWGTKWSSASFYGDKISGLQSFYSGMGGSTYEATNTEYTQTGGAHVGTAVVLGATYFDFSTAPKNGSRTSPILAEVCSQVAKPVSNGYYPVYIDQPRGHAGYCAWHSTGTCNGVQVQFAFFFNLDGDAGCDPQDGSGLHSQGLAALANVSGHELSEALTDPHLNAWYDSSGAENSDKCAWSFGAPLLTFKNGSQWKIQGNWSNAAYDASSGFANRSGQLGCIDGTLK